HTVSGTMVAAAGSAIDSDTNDRSASFFARNDSAAQAQSIGNPVTLGGHLNMPGAGPLTGRTATLGDVADWYRVTLARDQTIRLVIAEDGISNDLDLELRGSDRALVASSATKSRTEQVTVPATGDYYVVVLVKSGASNYTLSIGQALAVGSASEPEFVPGQV